MKHALKSLRHLVQACVRFTKSMRKRQACQQRVDAENLPSRGIHQFLYEEKGFDRQHDRAIT